jgi:hypothetical protein
MYYEVGKVYRITDSVFPSSKVVGKTFLLIKREACVDRMPQCGTCKGELTGVGIDISLCPMYLKIEEVK